MADERRLDVRGTHALWIGILVLPVLLPVRHAFPDETFEEMHGRLMAQNPKGLTLTAQTEKDTCHLGERVPVSLAFANQSGVKYRVWTGTGDRSGRIHDIAFHVEGRPGSFTDPLKTYFPSGTGGMGGLGGEEVLGAYTQVFDLNEWVRFDQPGRYRFFCTTSRVYTEDHRERPNLCSPILAMRIVPSDENYVQQTVDAALKGLKSEDYGVRRQAVRTLRFLSTPEAVECLMPWLEDLNLGWDASAGIMGCRDWEHARKVLHDGIGNPDVVVGTRFVRTLAHISLPRDDHLIAWDPKDQEGSRKKYQDHRTKLEAEEGKVLDRLAAVIASKRGRALSVGCSLLLERKMESPLLRPSLAKSFQDMTQLEQESILQYRWAQARCAEFEPVLEKILKGPHRSEDWRFATLPSWALIRYQDFQPQKARDLILQDVKRARPVFSGKVLCSLPDEYREEVEQALLGNLNRNADLSKIAPLIEHYASAKALPSVISLYQASEGRWACSGQNALLGYWVKHDNKNGLEAVARAARLRESTGCFRIVLKDVLGKYYGPEAEQLALSFLDDKDTDVILNVVDLLQTKGSEQCIEPLLRKLSTMETSDMKRLRDRIIMCFLEQNRWKVTQDQREGLKNLLRSDYERERFRVRFEPRGNAK